MEGKYLEDLTKNEGFPQELVWINGITISPKNSNRPLFNIENENGGCLLQKMPVKLWEKVNEDRSLRQTSLVNIPGSLLIPRNEETVMY